MRDYNSTVLLLRSAEPRLDPAKLVPGHETYSLAISTGRRCWWRKPHHVIDQNLRRRLTLGHDWGDLTSFASSSPCVQIGIAGSRLRVAHRSSLCQ